MHVALNFQYEEYLRGCRQLWWRRRVRNHGKEHSSLEQNWEKHAASLLPVLTAPVQTEVEANSELHKLDENSLALQKNKKKEIVKENMIYFYII